MPPKTVALFHFNIPFPALPDVYHRALRWGGLGVPVFFVVSGFCIAAARQKDGLLAFWFRRLARIYPPYLASVVLVLAVVGLRIAVSGANDVAKLPADLAGWIYTLAMLTSPASDVVGINWVYWSLAYEVAFYILVGVLAWRGSAVLLCLFSAVAFFLPGYPFDQWGHFGLGAACYYYTKRDFPIASILGAVCLASIFLSQSLAPALAGAATALVILFPPAVSRAAFLVPLRKLGGISYSFYLTHVPIGCYVLPHYLPWIVDRRLWPSLRQDLIVLLASLLFAYVFHRLVEKPSHDFARAARIGARNDGRRSG